MYEDAFGMIPYHILHIEQYAIIHIVKKERKNKEVNSNFLKLAMKIENITEIPKKLTKRNGNSLMQFRKSTL